MYLALKNLIEDRTRFLIATLGIVFATFLMTFQVCLLKSFLESASRVVDASDADLWVMARGVKCFDFSAVMDRRFTSIVQRTPEIQSVTRMCSGFAEYRKPNGDHQTIALVGMDSTSGDMLPHPSRSGDGLLQPNTLSVDDSALGLLAVTDLPMDVEINGNLARVVHKVSKYSSFLGSPYVFAEYKDASRYLRMTPEENMYLLVRLIPGADPTIVARDLQKRMPELDIWTKKEFSSQCERYWLSQTGAGGTILTSAFLGFLIGLAVVSQTIYAVTVEKIEEFATLRALGASRLFIAQVVLFQALICGVAGCLIAALLTWPLTDLARFYIPWVQASALVVLIMTLPSLGMCLLASFTAVRAALRVEPARVFRA